MSAHVVSVQWASSNLRWAVPLSGPDTARSIKGHQRLHQASLMVETHDHRVDKFFAGADLELGAAGCAVTAFGGRLDGG